MASIIDHGRPNQPMRASRTSFLVVLWTGLAIAIICSCLRFLARVRTFKKLLMDDYFVAFAVVLAIVYAIMLQILAKDMYSMMEVTTGLKPPMANLASISERWLRGSVAFILLYYSIIWSIKMSFLLFFKRLGTNVSHQNTLWWTIFVFTIATYFVCVGTTEYNCRTRSFEWIFAHCSSSRKDLLVVKLNCAWDVLTDFLIAIIPIRMLWGTQMKLKRKLALVGIFSLVVFTMIISIIRAAIVSVQVSETDNPLGSKRSVVVVDSSWLYLWSAVEISIAIVVACLASFRNLFSHHRNSRYDPKHHEPPDHSNLFLRQNKPRSKMRALIDVLASTPDDPHSTYQVHIDGGAGTRSPMRSDFDSQDPIPLQKAVHVHVKKEVHLVHEAV